MCVHENSGCIRTHFQEDIQLLPNVVNRGNLGLCFFDKVILLLLELLFPFVEPINTSVKYGGK